MSDRLYAATNIIKTAASLHTIAVTSDLTLDHMANGACF